MTEPTVTYFVAAGRDLRDARALLQRERIPYTERHWQAGMRAIEVPASADVRSIFAYPHQPRD